MALQFMMGLLETKLRLAGCRRRAFEASRGRKISYLEAGLRRPGKTLILIHGLGSSNMNWVRVIMPLARHHHVIAVDLPGFGRSPLPAELDHQTLREHTEALIEFLRSPLFPAPVVLAGQSMGGWIAVKTAMAAPEKVEQLVLINSAGVFYEGIEELRALLTPATKEQVNELWKRLWYRIPWYYRPFWKEAAAHMRTSNVTRFMDTLERKDFVNEDLPNLTVPVSVIWGRADRLIPPSAVDEIVKAVRSTRVFWLAKCGHIPPVEAPNQFMRAMRAVLSSTAEDMPTPPRRPAGSPLR